MHRLEKVSIVARAAAAVAPGKTVEVNQRSPLFPARQTHPKTALNKASIAASQANSKAGAPRRQRNGGLNTVDNASNSPVNLTKLLVTVAVAHKSAHIVY